MSAHPSCPARAPKNRKGLELQNIRPDGDRLVSAPERPIAARAIEDAKSYRHNTVAHSCGTSGFEAECEASAAGCNEYDGAYHHGTDPCALLTIRPKDPLTGSATASPAVNSVDMEGGRASRGLYPYGPGVSGVASSGRGRASSVKVGAPPATMFSATSMSFMDVFVLTASMSVKA